MIQIKLNGLTWDAEIIERKECLSIFGNIVIKYLVKRFLVGGGYDYQLVNDFNIIK